LVYFWDTFFISSMNFCRTFDALFQSTDRRRMRGTGRTWLQRHSFSRGFLPSRPDDNRCVHLGPGGSTAKKRGFRRSTP
jgi:hypothetical protein